MVVVVVVAVTQVDLTFTGNLDGGSLALSFSGCPRFCVAHAFLTETRFSLCVFLTGIRDLTSTHEEGGRVLFFSDGPTCLGLPALLSGLWFGRKASFGAVAFMGSLDFRLAPTGSFRESLVQCPWIPGLFPETFTG